MLVEKHKMIRDLLFATLGVAFIGWYTYGQVQDFREEMILLEERMDSYTVELMNEAPEPDYKEYLERHVEMGKGSFYDYTLDSGWSSIGHLVCATRDFERYSMVKVTNLDNGNTVICKVTDYVENPKVIIDLSSTAFSDLAPLYLGIINVSVEQL